MLFSMKNEEEMTMGKTSLLELDGADMSSEVTEDSLLDVSQQLLLLHFKHSGC